MAPRDACTTHLVRFPGAKGSLCFAAASRQQLNVELRRDVRLQASAELVLLLSRFNAGFRCADIRATSIRLAGGIEHHAALGLPHNSQQATFVARCPASDTGAYRYVSGAQRPIPSRPRRSRRRNREARSWADSRRLRLLRSRPAKPVPWPPGREPEQKLMAQRQR